MISNPRTANCKKIEKIGFPWKSLQIHTIQYNTHTILNWLHSKSDFQVIPFFQKKGKNFDLVLIFQKLQPKKVLKLHYDLWCHDATQQIKRFLASWWWELSNNVHGLYDWFRGKKFQLLIKPVTISTFKPIFYQNQKSSCSLLSEGSQRNVCCFPSQNTWPKLHFSMYWLQHIGIHCDELGICLCWNLMKSMPSIITKYLVFQFRNLVEIASQKLRSVTRVWYL